MSVDAGEIDRLLRELAPQVLGVIARRHGDFATAEDAVQEALIAAAVQWQSQGTPRNPRGWLYHVALRRLTDQLRSEVSRRRREAVVGSELLADWAFVPSPDRDVAMERDDTLVLLFMCCHPVLTSASAIALTLRAVGGLSTRRGHRLAADSRALRRARAYDQQSDGDVEPRDRCGDGIRPGRRPGMPRRAR